jgi:hypothetical protein
VDIFYSGYGDHHLMVTTKQQRGWLPPRYGAALSSEPFFAEAGF